MLATARTADAVSERVLAHLAEQYPARQQRQHHRHPRDLAAWSRDQPPHHTASSRDPAPTTPVAVSRVTWFLRRGHNLGELPIARYAVGTQQIRESLRTPCDPG